VTKIFTVILTFRKCKKNSPVLQQMLKMLPSWQHAVRMLVENVINSLVFLPSNCANMMVCTHHTHKTSIFFVMKRESVSPGFSLLHYWLLHRENQASSEENAKVDQFLIVYRLKNQFKGCVLATGSCFFKAWTTTALNGCSCNFVAPHAGIFVTVSWTEKLSATFSSRLIF
jgi:hypothetical protein